MIDEPSQAAAPTSGRSPAFRAGVSRADRLRQRFWATRVRIGLLLRRDRGTPSPGRKGR